MQLEILNKSVLAHMENEFSNIVNYKQFSFDKLEQEIIEVCKSLEVLENIKFIKVEKIEENTLLRNKRIIHLEHHRVERYKCFFEVSDEDGEETKTLDFFFDVPLFIDNEYFVLYGTTYRPIMQFINYKPVHTITEDSYKILCKTLINKFIINIKFLRGQPSELMADLFKKKFNLFLLLILLKKDIKVVLNDFFDGVEEIDYDKTLEKELNIIDLKTKMFRINDEDLHSTVYKKLVFNSINKLKLNFSEIGDETLLKRFGLLFTTNANTAKVKGERVLVVIMRMLDNITKRNLHSSINDMYDLIKIEIKNIYADKIDDNNNIYNRRLVFVENIFYPLLERLSNNLYIYLNSNYKNMHKLENIFKIQTDIIIKFVTTNELVLYDDSSNTIDSFLREKVSLVPQGMKKRRVSGKLRLLDKSYLGVLDVITSSNGDSAGLTTFMTPLTKDDKLLCLENGLFIEVDTNKEK